MTAFPTIRVAAIQAIREESPNAKIIVLTTYEGDEDIYRGLKAGARAYLLKDGPRENLLESQRTFSATQRRHSSSSIFFSVHQRCSWRATSSDDTSSLLLEDTRRE